MGGLVWIGKVVQVDPIPNADRIERVDVVCGTGGKWSGVVPKGAFPVESLCQVYLQDSVLPDTPEFAFLSNSGHRIRMARYRGVASECLVWELKHPGKVGTDITDLAGVTRFEKPLPANMGGNIIGHFPSFIPRTDEPNWQTVPEMRYWLEGRPWVATVKYDGTSTTAYWNGERFGVCSRNYELGETAGNALWQLARKYKLPTNLPQLGYYALQWETYGPGIQGNPVGVKAVDMALFNVWDIAARTYLPHRGVQEIAAELGVPVVALAHGGDSFDPDPDSLRALAEGTYPSGKQREGVVVRPYEGGMLGNDRVSFKVINLRYKD